MLVSLLMTVAIPQAFEAHTLLFAGSYVAIQVGRHLAEGLSLPHAGYQATGFRYLSLLRTPEAPSGTAGEFREVGFTLLFVGVAPFLCLLAAVEEEVSVVGELLDAGVAIFVGVEARFQET
jgi:hypothetical protein